ncbi:MAG: DNA primase [Candidatus Aenigmarchaeota archaeon]|nr:DNA primase [Candidatus Aenigmarchaeota archaeon]
MSKLAPASIKYVIKATISAKGIIEKPDVIGAIFGQTEGLLGSDLDLRELQRTGRIGRIEVNIKSERGSATGEIIIPSSLDSAETALIAATMETIDRVGPCTAKISLETVEDTRSAKRKFVVEKAKEILRKLISEGVPDITEISEEIKEAVRVDEVTSYQGLPCGPNMLDSDNVIIVEGRADVVNLLKFGIRNTLAIEGTSIPPVVVKICQQKVATVFFDGDRGGELNMKALLEVADIDFITTAPKGTEVEELSKKEVYKALRDKISIEQYKLENRELYSNNANEIDRNSREKSKITKTQPKKDYRAIVKKEVTEKEAKKESLPEREFELFSKTLDDIIGTRAACIFDAEYNILGKVPVKEIDSVLKSIENPHAVVFDGSADSELAGLARARGVKYLVGMKKDNVTSSQVIILSKEDFKKN